MVQIMIKILSKKNEQISLSENLNVYSKIQKSTKFFMFQQKKNLKTDRDGIATISSKIKFIDSARFMATSL